MPRKPKAKSKEITGVYGGHATLRYVEPEHQASDFYHWLLTTSRRRFAAALIAGYLSLNALFAIAYLACGDGIRNAKPGSFTDAFFFSVQTMATIGYGQMVPDSMAANILVTIEAGVGLFGMATAASLLFARFTRPTAGIRFSRWAVVTMFDGKPTLMFRLGNQRAAKIHEARVHVVFARDVVTQEGRPFRRLLDLDVARSLTPVLQLTWTVMHVIDEKSPFYNIAPEQLAKDGAAFTVLLSGHHEGFRQTVHARHTYMAGDIAWHHRFADLLSRQPDGEIIIDVSKFDELVAEER